MTITFRASNDVVPTWATGLPASLVVHWTTTSLRESNYSLYHTLGRRVTS